MALDIDGFSARRGFLRRRIREHSDSRTLDRLELCIKAPSFMICRRVTVTIGPPSS